VQGHALSTEEIRRIVSLLAETQMTMPEIAMRMQCSRSAIVSINRRFQVREYNGLRSKWENSRILVDSVPQPRELEPQKISSAGSGKQSPTAA